MNEGSFVWSFEKVFADGLWHLDEIAEHMIVLDPQRPASRLGGVAGLQRGDKAPRVLPQRPGLLEGSVEAGPHEAAVALGQGQFVRKRRCDDVRKRWVERAERAGRCGEFVRQRHGGRERQSRFARAQKTVADAGEVA